MAVIDPSRQVSILAVPGKFSCWAKRSKNQTWGKQSLKTTIFHTNPVDSLLKILILYRDPYSVSHWAYFMFVWTVIGHMVLKCHAWPHISSMVENTLLESTWHSGHVHCPCPSWSNASSISMLSGISGEKK